MQRTDNKKTAHFRGPDAYPLNMDEVNVSLVDFFKWIKEPLGKLPNGVVFNGPNYFINV